MPGFNAWGPVLRFKNFKRRLLQNTAVIWLLSAIAYALMEFVYYTNRWRVIDAAYIRSRWDNGQPSIICFWHNRLWMMCRCWRRGVKAQILISQHRDGRLIARTIAHYDVGTVVGSTSRGSAQAVRGLIDATKKGYSIGITPDGPRGPRYHAAMGPVFLAKLTGLPIIPVAVATTRRKVLRSWDRFVLNLPFGRGVFVWGRPVHVAADADAAAMALAQQAYEQELRRITDHADRLCGHAPIPIGAAGT